MKKLAKVLLILIGLFPLILNATESEEVKWKWYKEVEENVHYESDAEQICEYFETLDKNAFIYGPWVNSLSKPLEKEGREIVKEDTILNLNSNYISSIGVKRFDVYDDYSRVIIQEIEIYDKEEKLDYSVYNLDVLNGTRNNLKDNNLDTTVEVKMFSSFKLKLPRVIDINNMTFVLKYKKVDDLKTVEYTTFIYEDLVANNYASYVTNNVIDCDEQDNCTMKITVKDKTDGFTLPVKTISYKYRDKLYKCYTNKKIYAPGYYTDLDGYIKDETDFIVTKISDESLKNEEKSANIPVLNLETNLESQELEKKPLENAVELEEVKEKNEDKQVAIVTEKTNKEEDKTEIYSYLLLALFVIFIIGSFIFIAKKVKNSRAK